MASRIVEMMRASKVDTVVLGRHQATGYISQDDRNEEDLLLYVLGKVDPPLSKDGMREARASSPELMVRLGCVGKDTFLGVYSPTLRTEQTLEALAPNRMHCPDPRLGPPDYNAIPVAIREWVRKTMSIPECRELWINSPDFPKTVQRLTGAMESFLCNHKGTAVVVITHSEICGLLWCMLTGVAPDRFVEPEFYVGEGKMVTLKRSLEEGTHKYFSIAD